MSDIAVRPARADDSEAVFDLCAHTWPGGDYIPYVWDQWLADPDSALLVALAGTRPVGLVHMRMMSPDEGWLEGIRVDPNARRQGIGRVLVSRALVAAHERGAAVVRLITDHDNLPAQALFAHFGFTRIAEVRRYQWSARDDAPENASEDTSETRAAVAENGSSLASESIMSGQTAAPGASISAESDGDVHDGARIVTPGEAAFERIWEWLVQSNLAPLTGGLEFDGWSARALAEPFLRAELAAGRVYVLEEWGTILALAVVRDAADTEGKQSSLDVRYIDGLSEAIGRLALVLREVAQERRLRRVELWLPDLLILRDAMDGAGYTGNNNPMWVYARTL
ncbi:MAG: GNAT family N-acetyltransferase [Ktedonobacterales bacterium]